MTLLEPPSSGPTPPVSHSQPALVYLTSFLRQALVAGFAGFCVGRLGALLWQGLWVDAAANLCLAICVWAVARFAIDVWRTVRAW